MNLTDPELLAAAVTGERDAFDALVGRYHGLVRRACRRQIASAEVDDCVQAVFLVLLRKGDQAQRSPALPAWLLTVARHVCATARRSAGARRRAEQEAAMSTTLASAEPPPAAGSEHLDDCLARLPERQRAVIVLHFLAGVDRDGVAAALGVSVDTVHQHCHRGLARLRDLLRRRGVAIPAASLLALLAAENQASAVMPTPTLSVTSGRIAAAYASGASAMTIKPFVPIGVVATLVLAISATVIGLSRAEQAPTHAAPAPAATTVATTVATTIATAEVAGDPQLAARLTQLITLDMRDTELDDCLIFLDRVAGIGITVDPGVNVLTLVHMRVESMRYDQVLRWVCRVAHAHYELRNQGLFILPGDAIEPPESPAARAARLSFEQKLRKPVTIELADGSNQDALYSLSQLTGTNLVIDPAVIANGHGTVALKAKDMPEAEALRRICDLAGNHFEVKDDAVFVTTGPFPATPPTESDAEPGEPAPGIAPLIPRLPVANTLF